MTMPSIGRCKEYPTMHYFGIPWQIQSVYCWKLRCVVGMVSMSLQCFTVVDICDNKQYLVVD